MPRQGSRAARREGSHFTVVSMSISLVAVFIPILFMGGHRWASVPRVCRRATTAIARVAGDLVDHHADDVRAPSHGAKGAAARPASCAGQRAGVSAGCCALREDAALGPAASLAHAAGACWRSWPHRAPLVHMPKGFFPQQDTGVLSGGIRRTRDLVSGHARQAGGDRRHRARDPGGGSVMRLYGGGIGGGRQHRAHVCALKPLEERDLCRQGHRAAARQARAIPGATALPAGRTRTCAWAGDQRRAVPIHAAGRRLRSCMNGRRACCSTLRGLPELTDVNSDFQDRGLKTRSSLIATPPRASASPWQAIDNTLNNAFGQRQVSTMYAPLNQYRVVLEVAPQNWQRPGRPRPRSCASHDPGARAAECLRAIGIRATPAGGESPGTVRRDDVFVQPRARRGLRRCGDGDEQADRAVGMPDTAAATLRACAQAFQDSLASQPRLILRALVAIYSCSGSSMKASCIRSPFSPRCPPPALGPCWRCCVRHGVQCHGDDRHHPAHWHREKERHHDDRFCAADRTRERHESARGDLQACQLRLRPILMTTMAALLGALPLALGTGMGSELRRPLGVAIVGGLIVQPGADAVHHAGGLSLLDHLRLRFRQSAAASRRAHPTVRQRLPPRMKIRRASFAGCSPPAAAAISCLRIRHRRWRFPANFKEGERLEGREASARHVPRGEWWSIFHDSELNAIFEGRGGVQPIAAIAAARAEQTRAC